VKNPKWRTFFRWMAIPVWCAAVVLAALMLASQYDNFWSNGIAWMFLIDVFGLGFTVAMYFWFPKD
jgi:general stress protein CsbA